MQEKNKMCCSCITVSLSGTCLAVTSLSFLVRLSLSFIDCQRKDILLIILLAAHPHHACEEAVLGERHSVTDNILGTAHLVL